ncbi:hypothetical protein, partial [Stenotrophomonas pavanii]
MENKKDAAFAASFLFVSAFPLESRSQRQEPLPTSLATARRVPVRTTGIAMLGSEQAKRATRVCSSFFLSSVASGHRKLSEG